MQLSDFVSENLMYFTAFQSKYGLAIGVGTPPQIFDVLLDTGSADFWISSVSSRNEDDRLSGTTQSV